MQMCHCTDLLLSTDNQSVVSFCVGLVCYIVSPDILTNFTCFSIVWPRYIRGLQYQSCVLYTESYFKGGTFIWRVCVCVCDWLCSGHSVANDKGRGYSVMVRVG